jgi:hypothetical protein
MPTLRVPPILAVHQNRVKMQSVKCTERWLPLPRPSADMHSHGLIQADEIGPDDDGNTGMVTLHRMAEASFGQAGASATSVVYLGASRS